MRCLEETIVVVGSVHVVHVHVVGVTIEIIHRFSLSRSLAIVVAVVAVTMVHRPVVSMGVTIPIGAVKSIRFSSCEGCKADLEMV